MLTIVGLATLALIITAILAAFGKVDIDRSFGLLGYLVEFQFNSNMPLGIMVSKNK